MLAHLLNVCSSFHSSSVSARDEILKDLECADDAGKAWATVIGRMNALN